MFIEDNDSITIKIHFVKSGHMYLCYNDKEFQKLDDKTAEKYQHVALKMKIMTWGFYNELQDMAMYTDNDGSRKFNYKKYKETRLHRLILEWDVKDKDGKPVPVSEKRIAQLAPSVAETILDTYDEQSFLTEEDEKN